MTGLGKFDGLYQKFELILIVYWMPFLHYQDKNAWLVYCTIVRFVNREEGNEFYGIAWPTIDQIRLGAGRIGRNQAVNSIRLLETFGLLTIDKKKIGGAGYKNLYSVVSPPPQPTDEVIEFYKNNRSVSMSNNLDDYMKKIKKPRAKKSGVKKESPPRNKDKKKSNNVQSIWSFWRVNVYEVFNVFPGSELVSSKDAKHISGLLEACNRDRGALEDAMIWFIDNPDKVRNFDGVPSLAAMWGWRMFIIPASQGKLKKATEAAKNNMQYSGNGDRDSVSV